MRQLWGKCKTDWGKFVRSHREELKINQAELARRLGVNPTSISRTESGPHGTIQRSKQAGWADVLKVRIEALEPFVWRPGKDTNHEEGRRIRKIRKKAGLTLGRLAERLGVTKSAIRQREQGRIKGIFTQGRLSLDFILENLPEEPRVARCGDCGETRELVLGGLCADCALPFRKAYKEARNQARSA